MAADAVYRCQRPPHDSGLHTESTSLQDPDDPLVYHPYTMTWGDPVIVEAFIPAETLQPKEIPNVRT